MNINRVNRPADEIAPRMSIYENFVRVRIHLDIVKNHTLLYYIREYSIILPSIFLV